MITSQVFQHNPNRISGSGLSWEITAPKDKHPPFSRYPKFRNDHSGV